MTSFYHYDQNPSGVCFYVVRSALQNSQCVHLLYCVNKAFCFVNLAGIPKFKYERKNEKDSGRSSINEAIVQMAYCIRNENCLISEKDDYWRSCVPVITVTWLKLKYLLRGSTTEDAAGKKKRKEWLI